MSKLSEIVDAATGDTIPIPTLLRMVKVLAARTDTAVLDDWVDKELGGYAEGAMIPDYRGPFDVMVLSDWTAPFGGGIKNFELGSMAVPKGLRDAGAFQMTFHESVAALETMAAAKKPLHSPWSPNAIGLLNGQIDRAEAPPILRGYGLVSAHRVFSSAMPKAALDSVRSRVLALALELEKVLPSAGEPGQTADDPAALTLMVTNYIYGHGNNVAIASPNAIQSSGIVAGNLDSLIAAAQAIGLPTEYVDELREAIEHDDADSETEDGKPGYRVTQFLGKLTLGGLSVGSQVAIGAAGNVIGQLVNAYYGIS